MPRVRRGRWWIVIAVVALAAVVWSAVATGAREPERSYAPFERDTELSGVALCADGETPWEKADVELWWYRNTPEDSLPTAPLPRRPLIIVAGERLHVDGYGIVASLDGGPVQNVRLAVPPNKE